MSEGVELIEVGAAARRLGVSVQLVRRWVDRGDLAALRTTSGTRLIIGTDLSRLERQRAERLAKRIGGGR
jgi:excisionase family DNA binding protein